MANASVGSVRLVKCPKCLNILQELSSVPVYKCGGCGTILRAKIRATTTSGETASLASTQNVSMDISEKGLTISDSKDSLLNGNYSEKNDENSDINSSELGEKISEEKNTSSLSESPNTENSDSKSSSEMETPVETEPQLEEIVENKEKSSEENHASETLNRVNSDLNEKSEKHRVIVRKNTSSSVSEEFHTALNYMASENVPKETVIYTKPPRNLHIGELTKRNSYDLLQADILNRVDKLRLELVELFGKPPQEIGNYFQAESNRYRRVRINPNQNISKPNHHNFNLHFNKIEAYKNAKMAQITAKSKNLIRPILIGAPFVICSDCFKLIQLPTDFNVETKGLKKLQCGNCKKVLLFSYRPQPFGNTPLSYTGTETRTGTGMETTPYMDQYHKTDPISISEEYGLSFNNNISYSTETDQNEPLHVSRNSSFSTNDGFNSKKVVGSRLHQIMGYESASEILMRRASDVSLRNNEDYERERKGKGILVNYDDYDGSGKSKDRMKRSKIHGLFIRGVSKLMAN